MRDDLWTGLRQPDSEGDVVEALGTRSDVSKAVLAEEVVAVDYDGARDVRRGMYLRRVAGTASHLLSSSQADHERPPSIPHTC